MSSHETLEEQDLKILEVLQDDGSLSIAAISERTGLSQNACWRRLKRLEEDRVLTGRVALVDPRKVGLDLTVFVHVKASEHSEEWVRHFTKAVNDIPEVVEFYRMAGEIDYLLKLVVQNISAYDAVYKRLISSVKIVDVSASFAMEEIKRTTALPLRHGGTQKAEA